MYKLQDWANHYQDEIKYFSGTAQYTTAFNLNEMPKGKDLNINLGDVGVMAEVIINGKTAGGVWTFPYQLKNK